MCSVKSDANTQMPPKEQPNSSSTDEGSWSGSPTTDELTVLKKGPWTAAEDATLREFVNKYGEGNWNSVQKNSGLLRCGKSCRLRWANHLRPELKKMAFTQEEERFIIETHAKIGNKWAQMASLLPGRTDNEIKNYWNTRTKRRQRAGLPLYSHSNISPRALNVNHPIQNASQLYSTDRESNNGVQQGCLLLEIPEFQFDTFKTTTAPPSYAPPFSGIHFTGGILSQDLGPCTYSLLGVNHKRAREEEPFKELDTHSDSIYRNLGLDYPCHHELGYPYDPDPARHAVSNGINSSYSHLPGAVKMELPSLQYPETNYSNWLTTDSIHVLSPQNVSFLSECASPRNSGLLEALVHESRAISAGKKPSSEKSSCSSAITDPVESSAVNFCTAEWEEISNNRSAISLNGSDETMPCVERLKDSSYWLDFSRPDVLFDSDWFLRSSQRVEEISAMNDGFDAHIGQNPSEGREGNIAPADVHVPNGTLFKVSPGPCPWNSMPSVRQMLEHR